MKKCTGLLLSLAVLVLAAYYVMGLVVERTLTKNISVIPENPVLSVNLDDYQLGWFSSKTVLDIKMHIPEQTMRDKNGAPATEPPLDLVLKFPLIINHGPIIFTDAGIRFGMGHVTTRPQTHYQAFVNYFNNTLFKYTFPSVTFETKMGSKDFQFEMSGISALLSLSPKVEKVDGNITLYGLSGAGDNVVFKLGEVFNDFKFNKVEDGLWIGQTHYFLSSAALSMENKKVFDLEGFDLSFSSNIADGSLNFDFDASLKKLLVDDKNYDSGVLKLRIKNLDKEAMININKQQWKMMQNSQDATLPMLAMMAEMPKLFSKGAELELSELTATLPEGKITGNLKITLPKEGNPDQLLLKARGKGQFKAPMAAVRKLAVPFIEEGLKKQAERSSQDQSATRDPAVAITNTASPTPTAQDFNADAQKQVDKMLQDLVDQGILKVEGSDYVLNFELENQQITVNGKPFDPSKLK